jgi:hypothetical protein
VVVPVFERNRKGDWVWSMSIVKCFLGLQRNEEGLVGLGLGVRRARIRIRYAAG